MSLDRLGNSGPQNDPPARRLAQAPVKAGATALGGDELALSRRVPAARAIAPPQPFQWGHAMGHLWQGFKHEGKDMVLGAFQHPLKTVAMVAGTVALVALAPVILPVSAAAVGSALALGFVGLGLYKAGSGAFSAYQDHRRGDNARAEADFERIGRGAFDVAAVAVPAGLARAGSVLARTQAGDAVIELAGSSGPGRALGGVVESVTHTPVAQRLAGLIGRVGELQQAIARQPLLVALRDNPVSRGVGGAFNFVFDNPSLRRLIEADNAWAVEQINQSSAGVYVRDWALAQAHRAAGGAAVIAVPSKPASDKTGISGESTTSYQQLQSAQDFERVSPGFRQKVLKDLEQRGIKGYTADDIVVGRKRLFQANEITPERYGEFGIKRVLVDGQEKLAVPTLDSPKPLLYDPGTRIIQKLATNPDTGELLLRNGLPQPQEIYGVPAKKFGSLYEARPDGHFIATDKRVIAIRARAAGELQTPWDPMQVKPGDAIMYPIDRTEGGYSLGAPYRHEGGEVLRNAYTLGQ